MQNSKVGDVLARGSTGEFAGDLANLELKMKRPHFGIVVLEFTHTGARTTLAVDNLNFDEASPSANNADHKPLEIGLKKQLLVDDHVIAKKKRGHA